MAVEAKTLWNLVWGQPQVDPAELADAIAEEVENDDLDFRTRLLIRDGVEALKEYWGPARWREWLDQYLGRERIETILKENLGETGFPTLKERLMEKIDPEVVRQLLRELGTHLHQPVRLFIGGSIALIVPGYLTRATEDIDVVDEVPAEIRAQHRFVDELRKRYGLLLTHFQSHYLPFGWEQRVHFLDTFRQLQVYLVDVYDISLSKLFSARTRDLDDLRILAPQLDKDALVRRLREAAASLLASDLRQWAEHNWYVLYGESLPT